MVFGQRFSALTPSVRDMGITRFADARDYIPNFFLTIPRGLLLNFANFNITAELG